MAPAQGEGADSPVVDAGQVKSYFNPFDIDVEERNWYTSQIGHKNAREAKALVVHALFQIPIPTAETDGGRARITAVNAIRTASTQAQVRKRKHAQPCMRISLAGS